MEQFIDEVDDKEIADAILIEANADLVAAKRKARQKILYELAYADYKERLYGDIKPRDLTEALFFKDAKTMAKGTRNLSIVGYYWLTFTINPSLFESPELYMERLKKKVEKFTRRKCVLKALWNYELTANSVPHSHMLIELDPKEPVAKHKFESGINNTFKDVGYVNIKKCPDDRVPDKVQYILGNKWDEDKVDMVEKDRLWRRSEGIEDIYKTGDWGSLLS